MADAAPTLSAGSPLHSRRRGFAWVIGTYLLALAAAVATAMALSGHDPILVALAADVVATAVVFAFSLMLDNSSMYDPYWSIAPIPIVLYWATAPGGSEAVPMRQFLVVLLVAAWGVRLTANWAARWHGLSDEDFRYVEIRGKTGRLYWPASFFSIHLFPTGWVFLGLLSTWPALNGPARPLGWLDAAAVLITFGAIVIEGISDLQLRRFMSTRRDKESVLDTGLWAWSRHPNYFGEVMFWWGLWLLGYAARPSWAWTAVGPISITLLFALVSIPWMDRRMLSRHPSWAGHMKRTSAFFPLPPRG
jgi:steroid 5-alpha reductase family enzyme